MSTERIHELITLMNDHGLVIMEVEEEGFKVHLEKDRAPAPTVVAPMLSSQMPALPAALAPAATQTPAADAAISEAASGLVPITSPIVGTFYAAPAPDADDFVMIGDRVSKASTVCIIEAMKIMNEIPAEASGVIEKILVENGQAVEYGQELFLLKPSS